MYKKFPLLLSFFILLQSVSFAQLITPSNDSLNFGNVMVGDKDSLSLSLTNISGQAIQVNNVKFYTIYNDFPFSASASSFTLPAGGSYQLWIYFEPTHNILNNSELVIQHTANTGVESIDLRGQGVFPNPYYNVTQNLEEQALKNALKNRLAVGYNQLSYNAARDAMFMSIDNQRLNGQGASVNSLECVYTGYTKTGYTSRTNAQNTNPKFNTEHTFPQVFFNSSLPERSDIHHLFPTTNNSNSQRGNKAFGNVSNGTPVTLGGGSFYNSTTFEPRNVQKGRAARAMMYFVIRYQDYSNHFSPQENILRSWHNSYPPDSVERQRNDDIYTVQNNRNPFVDYPQLEERITNFVSNSTAPSIFGLDILQTSIDFGTFLNQQPDTFEYVLVNRGNQSINFCNFSLSNTNFLRFAGTFGGALSIGPGDALIIPVISETQNPRNINESLSFNTNLPGSQSSLTIPIRGSSIIVSLEERKLTNFLKAYPNPMNDQLRLENRGGRPLNLELTNVQGQLLRKIELPASPKKITLSVSSLRRGIYFLNIKESGSQRVIKLVK